MFDHVPTFYSDGPSGEDDEHLVVVRLPADVADELMIVTLWLSLQLNHRLQLAVLQRALVLGGVANARRVLAELQRGPVFAERAIHVLTPGIATRAVGPGAARSYGWRPDGPG